MEYRKGKLSICKGLWNKVRDYGIGIGTIKIKRGMIEYRKG